MISVCVASYNGERFLAEQLASILRSPRVSEVLVSDDGSTDRTRDIALGFSDPRIRLIEGPKAGLIRNYEHLLAQAKGSYIFLADQDDVWLPDKVDLLTSALQTADLVVSDCVVVDGALNELHPSFFVSNRSAPGLLRNLAHNSYLGCCIAVRRELLRHALPFPDDLPMHDWWLGLVAEAFGRVAFVRRPLVLYRRHGTNASSASERSRTSWPQRLAWRITLVRALLARRFGGRRPDNLFEPP